MSWLIEEFLFFLLAFIDYEITRRKISEFGLQVELNPVIRKLASTIGIKFGTWIGILIPTGIIAYAGWYHQNILSFALGARTLLFLLQLRTSYGN